MQGGWTNVNENGIPFERPDALAGKQLEAVDDSELAELVKERDEARLKGAAAIGGRETGAGPVHWYEHYGAKNSRAWMVIDPARSHPGADASGDRAPWRTRGRARWPGRRRRWWRRLMAGSQPLRSLHHSRTARLDDARDLRQRVRHHAGAGIVAIRYEMIHETRIIRLDASPRNGLRTHMGDARGHFEGDTLVVETTNLIRGRRTATARRR